MHAKSQARLKQSNDVPRYLISQCSKSRLDLFLSASVSSACILVTGPISALAFSAAIARYLAGCARAQRRRRLVDAVVRGKHQAAFVAALKDTFPAVHVPPCRSRKFGSSCVDMCLKRLKRRKRVCWKLREYVSERAEMAQTAPK